MSTLSVDILQNTKTRPGRDFVSFLSCFITSCSPQHSDQTDEHYRSEKGYNETVDIEAGYTRASKITHQPATNERPDHTHNNIEKYALLLVSLHDQRRYPTDKSSEYNPKYDSHIILKNYC